MKDYNPDNKSTPKFLTTVEKHAAEDYLEAYISVIDLVDVLVKPLNEDPTMELSSNAESSMSVIMKPNNSKIKFNFKINLYR